MSAPRKTTIGITRSLRDPADPTVFANYGECVARAGAAVRWVRPGDDIAAVLAEVDGLLFSGGADIDPARYGAAPHPRTALSEGSRLRDGLEFPLMLGALERDLPVLGICRGLQLLNVALGGTLHQHIERHQEDAGGHPAFHEVQFDPASRLAQRLGIYDVIETNSLHHQAIDRPASGLEVVGYSADGAIEAVESAVHSWVFGVQCHPERSWETPLELDGLFSALVEAAAGRTTRAAIHHTLSVSS